MAESTKRWSGTDVDVSGDTQPTSTPCLTDAEVLAFAQGKLSEAARDRVHGHVDGCGVCWSLLNEAVHAVDPSSDMLASGAASDWATTFRRGALVAQRYEIRTFLARGGMGEVYEAFDRQLQERIALKTVSSTACDSQRAVRDLKAEVYLARRVTHPNVCRIYDLGTHVLRSGAPLYFLTMEFVEGETLGSLVRRSGPIPLAEAERFARALLLGLSAAHTAGILHRDFKSDNAMVRTDADGQRTPVILDFGLARSLDERSRARSSSQAFVGTLNYMAPEQVEGNRLSRATDIYAFGVVWFEMLTGKLPFGGTPQMSALERLHKTPALPSQVNPAVPKVFDPIVSRCLSRVPEDRFQSADDVLAAWPVVAAHAPTSRKKRALRVAQAALFVGLILVAVYVAALGRGRDHMTQRVQSSTPSGPDSSGQAASKQPVAPWPSARSLTAPPPELAPGSSSRVSSKSSAARSLQRALPRLSASGSASLPGSLPSDTESSSGPAPPRREASAAPSASGKKWPFKFPAKAGGHGSTAVQSPP